MNAYLDSMSEAMFEISVDNSILRANKAVETMFGLSEDALVGKSIFEVVEHFRPVSNSDVATISNAIKASEGVVSGYCLFQKENSKRMYLGWLLAPLEFNGAARGRILVLLDLTERNDLQTALLQQREDFLAVLNHRLRTPVIAANRIIRLLLDAQFGKLSEKQEEVIALLSDNLAEIDRLMIMIMDIYRYRSSSKQLSLSEIELGELIRKVISTKATGKTPIELKISNPKTIILCDSAEICNLLKHLVDNAVRYARSRVQVNVEDSEDQILISVEDDGHGILPDDIKGLFDRFYVVSSTGKYAPVTGAGLCLCSEIAKAHGGSISCSSVVGSSTRFDLRLPVCKDGKAQGP